MFLLRSFPSFDPRPAANGAHNQHLGRWARAAPFRPFLRVPSLHVLCAFQPSIRAIDSNLHLARSLHQSQTRVVHPLEALAAVHILLEVQSKHICVARSMR